MSGTHPQPSQPHRWRWKRTIVIALLLLVGGAIVNIAVAWGGVILTPTQPPTPPPPIPPVTEPVSLSINDSSVNPPSPGGPHGRLVQQLSESDWRWIQQQDRRVRGTDQPVRYYVVSRRASRMWCADRISFFMIDDLTGRPDRVRFRRMDAGWPLRAVRTPNDRRTDRGHEPAIDFLYASASALRDRPLEFRPIFPGFIINTLFYAALLWLLLFGPFAARRMLRRRRGLCAKCAYPVGTSPVCTECGAAVPRKIARKAEA